LSPSPRKTIAFQAALTSLLAALLGAAPAAGAASAGQQITVTRTLRIERLAAEIRVDGALDENVWSRIAPESGFVQTEPLEGQPVSERTEVRIFYDDRNLYFAFWCYDREPEKMIARYDTHDARTYSDSVNIFLDPFGDRRTGYYFSVNARGVQFDALMTEGGDPFDSTWDGIWQSAARLYDWGWAAEVAIPFKSIRFAPGQTWGINLGRDIVRKNESANWQLVARFDGFMRPSKAGLLEGIGDVEPGRNLEIIPYVSSRVRRGAFDVRDNGEKYEGGADLRWGVLPNATVNLAVNPDFADTEADEIDITVSRFELFFPEKRAFFNEGANFFTTPMSLFFTRRVGARLPDGQPQRILVGAKLTGKVGPWSLGLLEARTQEQDFRDPGTGLRETAAGANFFTARGQADIWGNSTLGFVTVNRDQEAGATGSTQRVHGLDLKVIRGEHVRWVSQWAYNQNQTTAEGGIHRMGGYSDFNYETNLWEIAAGYKYVGRGFDVSAIGFEPEIDRHTSYAAVEVKPFFNRNGVRQIFFEINQDIKLDTRGLTHDSGSDADLTVQFTNFWSARVRYSYDLVRFNEFTPAFGRLPDTRIYTVPIVRFFLNSNENRPVFFNYQFRWQKFVQFRENFYGRGQTHELSANARMFGRTRLEFRGIYVREFLEDGTPFQNRRLFVTRVAHQFSRKWRARILGQVANDRRGQEFNVNSVVGYDFTARSAFLVGYNFQRRSPGQPGDLGHELFIKLSYLFQF
jgi:hypothetical protein